jgi:hypothetical protein
MGGSFSMAGLIIFNAVAGSSIRRMPFLTGLINSLSIALAAGLFFGFFMACYYEVSSKQNSLSQWEQLQ